MRRIGRSSWVVALAIAGCTIEQTPQEFIDRLETPGQEIAASEAEVRARLLSVTGAIQRRSGPDIEAALLPHSRVFVVGLLPGEEWRTGDEIAAALIQLRGEPAPRFEDVVVEVVSTNNVAWFRGTFAGANVLDSIADVRISGVFVRQEGAWRLLQGHLSAPDAISPRPPPPAPAGTAAGGE